MTKSHAFGAAVFKTTQGLVADGDWLAGNLDGSLRTKHQSHGTVKKKPVYKAGMRLYQHK